MWISKTEKGSKPQRFGPFCFEVISLQRLAGRDRPPRMFDRHRAGLRDRERNALARIARARPVPALAQRHGPAVDLQMRAAIVGVKGGDEAGAVGAMIAPESLR